MFNVAFFSSRPGLVLEHLVYARLALIPGPVTLGEPGSTLLHKFPDVEISAGVPVYATVRNLGGTYCDFWGVLATTETMSVMSEVNDPPLFYAPCGHYDCARVDGMAEDCVIQEARKRLAAQG